jgi:hypothetical protein
MAAIITAGGAGATATHAATGTTQVIVSGALQGARVRITVLADALPAAPVYTFDNPGAISLQCAAGTTIRATVTQSIVPVTIGTSTPLVAPSVNVSCI